MKILVTGFDPFGNETINPAIETVKQLPSRIKGHDIIKLEVPTIAYQSLRVIEDAIEEYQPDIIVSLGQAGGRSHISVERIGINLNDFRIPDNQGNQYIDTPIFEDGEDAYFSNLPIKKMAENMNKHQIPAMISNSAGTFVCNHVLYGVRYLCKQYYPHIKSGFIHIPYLPGQVVNKPNTASMSLECIVTGIKYALEAIIEEDK